MIAYTTTCRLSPEHEEGVWLSWITDEEVPAVCRFGSAADATVLRVGDRRFEIRYWFTNQEDFERFDRDHRAEVERERTRRFPRLQSESQRGELIAAVAYSYPR